MAPHRFILVIPVADRPRRLDLVNVSTSQLDYDGALTFALTKLRVEFDERDELVVAPEVELLGSGPDSP